MVAFAFSTLWALYATALLTAGVVLRSKDLRVLAVVLFGLTVGKMAFSDLWLLETGQRLIGFIGIGGLLLGCSLMFHRFKGLLLDEPASSSAPVVEAGL